MGLFAAAIVLAVLAALAFASTANAGTVTGTVTNGTTGKPAANIQMILIQLQGGMQPVAETKTDAQGKYSFDNPQLGAGPMLIRAVYRGVNYHDPATPGKTVVDMQVFDPTDKPGAVAITAHAIILQPDGADLDVGEEYNVTNKTNPPLAFYKAGGSFEFSLPEGAADNQISAVSSAGMPVIQTTIDKGKGKEAIAYAFRPGESGIRMSYKVPYANNQAKLTFSSPYAADRVGIFVPPTVQVAATGLSPAGTEQGFSVYMLQSVAANAPFTVSVSGSAPPPPQGGVGTDAGQDASASSAGAQAPTAMATTLPARLDSLKWTIAIGFAAIFALGLIFLLRRPEMVTDTAMDSVPAPGPRQKRGRSKAADAIDDVNQNVHGSLDQLKENLFKLELRRQAGTIAEEDYAREHARMQKLLRDLVKG
jgi:hypothetical protein